jgi:hypothetical protein
MRPLVKSARRSDLPFLRYGHFVGKSQILMCVMPGQTWQFCKYKKQPGPQVLNDKPKSLDWRGGGHLAVKETAKSLAIAMWSIGLDSRSV